MNPAVKKHDFERRIAGRGGKSIMERVEDCIGSVGGPGMAGALGINV